jgi:hypothetical protein
MNSVSCVARRVLIVLGFGLVSNGVALASPDHVRARQALASGEIMALDKILAIVSAKHQIQVLEIELDDESGLKGKQWIYEIKGLAPESKLIKLKVDARTGEILSAKTKGGARSNTEQK